MEQKKDKKELFRVLKFVGFSCSAGVIQILVSQVLNLIINSNGGDFDICYLIGLACSVIWNFTFNRKFTFKAANNIPKAMVLALIFYIPFTPYTTWLTHVLENQYNWIPILIQAVCMAQNLVLEYLWQRFVVFRGSVDSSETKKEEE